MNDFKQYSNKDVIEVCENLLKDSFLYIKFEDNPFSITLEFISNIESKLVKFMCRKISKFKIEKDSDENAFYTVLEVSASYVQAVWKLHILPEIEVTLECKELLVEISLLSKKDLKKIGLL